MKKLFAIQHTRVDNVISYNISVRLMDWKRFHRLRDIYDFIDELERDYPAICTVSVIGKSVEGRDIKVCKRKWL